MKQMTDVERYIENGKETRIKDVKLICPSPFFNEPELTNVNLSKDEEAIYNIVYNAYKRDPYTQITKNFTNVLRKIKYSPITIELLAYIADNAPFNSNKIFISSSIPEITAIVGHPKNFSRYIKQLEEMDVIAKTNKRGFYIINHTVIFRGSYPWFISRYIKIYQTKIDKNIEGKIELRKGNL